MAKNIDDAIIKLLEFRKEAKDELLEKEKELNLSIGYCRGLEAAIEIIEEAAINAK